jgi:hypothetical protein
MRLGTLERKCHAALGGKPGGLEVHGADAGRAVHFYLSMFRHTRNFHRSTLTLMNRQIIWSRITAVFVVLLGTAWAIALVRAIWDNFAGRNAWKIGSTITVLFVFAIVLHWVARGPRSNAGEPRS